MTDREFVIAVLGAAESTAEASVSRSIPSRTMLQKLVYLLSAELGTGPEYEAHYYGPYSRPLQSEITRLASTGIISEVARRFEPYEPQPFDSVQYTYSLEPDGRSEYERLPARVREAAEDVVRTSRRYWRPGPLSVAAKLHYLRQLQPDLRSAELPDAAKNFGWRISSREAEEGASLVQELGLA